MEPLLSQIVPYGRTEASEHRCGGGTGEPGAGQEWERGYLLKGTQLPGGPAPLLSGPQEKPGRAMLGGALGPQLSPPKTRKCQR